MSHLVTLAQTLTGPLPLRRDIFKFSEKYAFKMLFFIPITVQNVKKLFKKGQKMTRDTFVNPLLPP
jgi:hypothetical protein